MSVTHISGQDSVDTALREILAKCPERVIVLSLTGEVQHSHISYRYAGGVHRNELITALTLVLNDVAARA